ncbi:MAG: leucine-rich repeat domain-containing protein [Tannerella sp.]|nr:leucine-rich repeat domain-containing protein [Tannerella sp.]
MKKIHLIIFTLLSVSGLYGQTQPADVARMELKIVDQKDIYELTEMISCECYVYNNQNNLITDLNSWDLFPSFKYSSDKGINIYTSVSRVDDTKKCYATTLKVAYPSQYKVLEDTLYCYIKGAPAGSESPKVAVKFAKKYTISITPPVGTTITDEPADKKAFHEEKYQFKINRNPGYENHYISISVDKSGYAGKIDINQSTGECTIRNVQDDLTVNVTLIPTYEIIIPAITGATIDPATWGRVEEGKNFTFTVDRNNINDSIQISTVPGGYEGKIEINQSTGECTIRNVQDNLTVNVTLIPTYEISFSPMTGATISNRDPSGQVVKGEDFSCTVNKQAGYEYAFIEMTVDKPDKCGTIVVDQATGASQITDVQDNLVVTIKLIFLMDAELKQWIANHKQAFTDYGVKVENDGNIIFTPANLAALASMTSLEVTDSEAMLAIDTSPGGPLPQSDYTITTIDDLLAFMPNLEYLNCSGNKLTSLDLSANKELESLYCTKNKLTYLDISETKIAGMFMGRDQVQPFVMKVTRSQYRMMQGEPIPPYPSWTEFIFVDGDEDPGYPSLIINRKIVLNICEGLIITPSAGTHYITSGKNFSFRYYVKDGYNAENIKITTGIRLYDEHIKTISENDGSILVTIYAVRHAIEINIMGVEPTSGVSNIMINEKVPSVWSYQQMLYVRTPYATEITIYDTKGILHKKEQVTAGQQSFFLPKGVYIVRFDGNRTQKIVIR